MQDCIIIGSGPAGISAALTLKANGKSFIWLGRAGLSEKISKAERIRNYPALSNVTGKAFCEALQNQILEAEITLTEETAMGVYALNGKFGVATQEGNYYEGKTVILACGVESVKTIVGETEFLGRGVSYCATCDGFLYKDKTIAVLCTSKRLEHEIGLLADFAKQVYLMPMYKDVEIARENITIIHKMPLEIVGETRVQGVLFSDLSAQGLDKELKVDGVFALRESVSPATLINGLEMQDGHVRVTRGMETNIVGCFAAGDCTGRPYQYAKAVGEGNVAAHSVSAFLTKQG